MKYSRNVVDTLTAWSQETKKVDAQNIKTSGCRILAICLMTWGISYLYSVEEGANGKAGFVFDSQRDLDKKKV